MKALISVLLATVAVATQAKDLGVQGTVWPILEQDMREYVVISASKTDWDAVNQRLKEKTAEFPDTLKKRVWPAVGATSTVWMDPSIELTEDIQAPVKGPDGKLSWQVMIPKGTKANPLSKVRPTSALLFFDGADPVQVDLVRDALRAFPGKVQPIESGRGSVRQVSEALGAPIFHASDEAIQRFQVRGVPTLVYPGAGERSLFLGNTVFVAPYDTQTLRATWPEFDAVTTPSKSE